MIGTDDQNDCILFALKSLENARETPFLNWELPTDSADEPIFIGIKRTTLGAVDILRF